METKEKVVNFGRLAEAFNRAQRNPSDSNTVKKWEKIFDEEWAKPINTISSAVEYISAWLCYVPPSRRPILLNRLLTEAIAPKALHDCLAGTTGWEEKEKEELEKAWQEASKLFSLNNEPFLLKSEDLIALANNIFYLAPPWQAKVAAEVSQLIVAKRDDDNVKKFYLAITTPGDLSNEACCRFLKTVADKKEAESMILKLSLIKATTNKIDANPFLFDVTLNKIAEKLWKEVLREKFLKTKTLGQAEEIISDFTSNNADILVDAEACHHLTRFIENYETGEKIYKMIIAIHGKSNLIAVPAMKNWSPYLTLRLMDTNFPDEKIHELYAILFGEMKNKIREIYCERVVHEWLVNPL